MNIKPLTAKQRLALAIARQYMRRSTKGLRCSAAEINDLVQRGYSEAALGKTAQRNERLKNLLMVKPIKRGTK